jgi:hypothetical protein
VRALREAGYDPARYVAASAELARVIDLIEAGFFSLGEPERSRATTPSPLTRARSGACDR